MSVWLRLRGAARLSFASGPGRWSRVGIAGRLLAAAALVALAVVTPGAARAANPAANLDQCANDQAPSPSSDGCNTNANQWVNGNLGDTKSLYFEGDFIPYRLTFSNLPAGTHTVTIEWDTTKSSK